jgi:hypothetical protein
MELNKAQALCIELMNKHGLTSEKGWKFEWIKSKRVAGRCISKSKGGIWHREYCGGIIQLSSFVTLHHGDDKVLDTILHEIAHGLTPGHGHDYVWRNKAISIGCNGERCYDVNESEELVAAHEQTANFIGTCPKCSGKFFKTRVPKRDSWCKCTGRKFLQSEKLVFVANNTKKPTYVATPKPAPVPKVPITASRGFQQFAKPSNGHTSFPNTLLNQAPDSYKGMLDKFEKEFLALPAMMSETRNTFENIVMKAKTSSSSWRTMNREVRKACNVWIVENGWMTNADFQAKFFYEGVMLGRTTWGKNAPWAGKFEGYVLPKAA